MATTLKIDNFGSLNILETTTLNADIAAAGTALTVKNNQNISAGNFLVIGTLGSESSELRTVASTTGDTTVTTDALDFAHSRFEQVTRLLGDKIKVYRAANSDGSVPADDDFTVLTTLSIDVDQQTSTYTDATGGSDYWYKFAYYNSTTSAITSLEDSPATRGGGYGDYCSVESIRKEAGLTFNQNVTDADIDEKRQAAQAVINSKLANIYTVPFSEPINPIIAELTRKLAAGYLLTKSYGAVNSFSTNEGQQKIDAALKTLEELDKKTMVLIDATGADSSSADGTGGYPDDSTGSLTGQTGGADRLFSMEDRY